MEIEKGFCNLNGLKITNTFIRKNIHKFTWTGRDYRSLIHYVIVNKNLAGNVKDTPVFRGEDIGSDNFFVISTTDTYAKYRRRLIKRNKNDKKTQLKYKVSFLQEESIRNIYATRLNQHLPNLETKGNIQEQWNNMKEVVKKAVVEAQRTKRKLTRRKA